MRKRSKKSDPEFRLFFGVFFGVGTLSTGSKNGAILQSAFWKTEYRDDFHFGARFWEL